MRNWKVKTYRIGENWMPYVASGKREWDGPVCRTKEQAMEEGKIIQDALNEHEKRKVNLEISLQGASHAQERLTNGILREIKKIGQ